MWQGGRPPFRTTAFVLLLAPAAATAVAGGGCLFEAEPVIIADDARSLIAGDPLLRSALALRWAPIHHQDVDRTGPHAAGGTADYITRIDFDGDLEASNNWDNVRAAGFSLAAHAYYSVVETRTHWFIVFLFFHPRDWANQLLETEHENDAEGLMLVVVRDGSTYGALRAAVTVAHADFFSYLPADSSWRPGLESVDGTLPLADFAGAAHPVTAQEARGHGLKARPYYDIGAEGVVYYPSLTTAEVPSGPNDSAVLYKLVDILEPGGLWANRNLPSLFSAFGAFAGNGSGGCGSGCIACAVDAANAPWGWDDGDDYLPRGALATDPAALARGYFDIPEPFSLTYTYQPYR
jgi:hypothetical protein